MDIDYVVLMIFPQDMKWRHDYLSENGMYRDSKQSMGNPRYRTWGTENLLIKCIRKNLPWIRTIHIILARESQAEYLNRDNGANGQDNTLNPSTTKIHFVYHRDIMPKEVLPTFNSRAIEMYLHRIPGLADFFLYGNDDMFPLSPMGKEDFFREVAIGQNANISKSSNNDKETAVLPCLHYTKKAFNPNKAFHLACMNGLNFVAAEFGKHYSTEWMHIGHNVVPMLRSTCEMFWQRWPKEMEASVTKYRQIKNYNQYIYSWWHILSGQYVDYKQARSYISTDYSANEIIDTIRTTDGLLCINDNEAIDDITNLSSMVRNEIEKRL